MEPSLLGRKYDKIAQWWHERHEHSNYGVAQLTKALSFSLPGGRALDVGCGTGGRLVRLVQERGFSISGIDVSSEMIALARLNHPEHDFIHEDICTWQGNEQFEFIYAWDSIFHIPYGMHTKVISKLCNHLTQNGVLFYSFGDALGEHTDTWHEDTFYYSSIGINENLKLLMNNGMTILHIELDQYPLKHVYVIAKKSGLER